MALELSLQAWDWSHYLIILFVHVIVIDSLLMATLFLFVSPITNNAATPSKYAPHQYDLVMLESGHS